MKTLFKNRKAFTLIELIAVVSILGVLVLLAVPNFASHVGKAHEAHITNDIRFFESAIAAEKLKGNKDITEPWHTVTPEQMGTLMTEEVLYDKDGIVKAEEEFDGLLSIIEDNLIRSHLEGQFYVTLEGKVYYNDGADLVGEEPIIPEVPEPIDPTPNEDFTFIESSNTNAYTGPGGVKGYFKYVGTGDEVVKIPHHIEGIELTSYFSMFSETGDDVRKVISTNDNITNMSHMFADFGGAPLDITEINSKNVTNMSSMFEGYRAFLVDLSGLDTSSVENMSSMFAHTSAMTLDMTSFDTSNVTNMNRMFYDSSASNLDLSTFNTANVKSMSYMFGDALATSVNTSNFDTSKVYDMSGMYSNSKLNNIDVSHFDSSSLTNIAGMFHGVNLAELDLSAIDFTNIDTMNGFYTYNASGQGGNGHGLFEEATIGNVILNDTFTTDKLQSFDRMFAFTDIGNIEYVFAKINTQNATSMSGMFHGIRSNVFEQEWNVDFFDEFSTLNVTDMSGMFAETYTKRHKFNQDHSTFSPGPFDTINVENMSYMFAMSEIEENYYLQSFDLSSVTDMTNMFKDIIDISADGYYVGGWAKNLESADMLNNSPGKPDYLIFGTPVM